MENIQKEGLTYFPMDCHLDEKLKLMQAEFGLKGLAVIILLYQKIYGEFGYYAAADKKRLQLFMVENSIESRDYNFIQSIISACIKRDIFSRELFDRYQILTSHGIQKRYLNALAKRKVKMEKAYLLLSDAEIGNNVTITTLEGGLKDGLTPLKKRKEKEDEGEVKEKKRERKRERKEKSTSEEDDVYITSTVNQLICSDEEKHIVDTWNSLPDPIMPIQGIAANSRRRSSFDFLLSQYGEGNIIKAIENIKNSDFLQGKKTSFVVHFDWFIDRDHFAAILEGKYNNRVSKRPNSILNMWGLSADDFDASDVFGGDNELDRDKENTVSNNGGLRQFQARRS